MNVRSPLAVYALVMMALAAPSLGGQLSRAGQCPVVGGVSLSVTARDTGATASRDLVRVDDNRSVDTAFAFNVIERRWALAELAASVAAGLADTIRGKWYLCAGAGVGLTRPTLVVRGARGQIRLRASLAELSRALGSRTPRSDPTRTPPRRS
jgi:hypothetical protein